MRDYKCVWRRALLAGVAGLCLLGTGQAIAADKVAAATVAPSHDVADDFGAREAIFGAKLSPDGLHVLYLAADRTTATAVMVADADGKSAPHVALTSDGRPMRVNWCDWADKSRIVCSIYMLTISDGIKLPFTRLLAVDMDGRNLKSLSQTSAGDILRISQFDGDIVDWNQGETGKLLMERDHVPERDISSKLAKTANGLGVDLIDTHSLSASKVEEPAPKATDYISDGKGVVRMMSSRATSDMGYMRDTETYYYRLAGSRQWRAFSSVEENGPGLRPQSIDPVANVAYCFDRKTGFDALYRVALDGTMKIELVYSDPKGDVDDVVRLGRQARLIGASSAGDKRHVVYFDKEYEALANALGRALPGQTIDFVSSSADEQTLLLYAGSDIDPGRYYVFDRKGKHLNEIALVRPQLEHAALAQQTAITYRAADGTMIPAYLTLPAGGAKRGLPAIVMPHGGPSSRDEWGFDWLVQFFAARGYAVLQPEYRGSSGYGDAWLMKQGFQSWKAAIGDVVDAGHYLVSSGIAAPDKLAIVGWSYGGYAALQSNVVAPDLFKAVVAIAPVTDFDAVKSESLGFTNAGLVAKEVGSGPHIQEGSPARHADAFKAPVLLFHGTDDLNVKIGESQLMNDRLKAAGKQSQLVTYPGLDHPLPSGEIRADMLRRADAFLRTSMHMAG